MLAIGMKMNGYTVVHAVSMFRKGQPDDVIIVAHRPKNEEEEGWVVARVSQREVDATEPATFWQQGHYFDVDHGDTPAKVMEFYLRETELAAFVSA